MRDFALRLDTTRCPEGVEIVRGDIFSYRSDREERVVREALDLESPLVTRYVNARDDDKRIDFLSCFGLPLATKFIFSPYPSTSRLIIEGGQKQLRRILTRAGSGDAARAADAANEALASAGNSRLSQNAGRMVATLQNVFGFMCVEVALAAMNGDRLASCKWCRDVFLIGPRTNRRATAKFCKDLCRVKWNRAKST